MEENKSKEGGTTQLSKEVVESYVFSTARRDIGIHGERLLLRLVELAQCHINGLNFKSGEAIGKVRVSDWGDAEVVIPVRDILSGDKDKNYERAKEAVLELMTKILQYEDDTVFRTAHILNNVDLNKVSGSMSIVVNREMWAAMLDFSKGFRKYDLQIALRLKSRYSIKLYKLVSKQTTPITYSIDELRREWELEDKYKRVDDFVSRTLGKAKEELDRVSPYSFEYVLNSSRSSEVNRGRKGRPAVTSVTIYPVHLTANETKDTLRNRVDPSLVLSPETKDILYNKFEFDFAGVKANLLLFETAEKYLDFPDFLRSVAPSALRADNVQGYVVSAVRKHLREKAGIIIDGSSIIRSPLQARGPGMGAPSGPLSLGDLIN